MRKHVDLRDVRDACKAIDRKLEKIMWWAIGYFIALVMGAASAVVLGLAS
jgi:hypothetical protein